MKGQGSMEIKKNRLGDWYTVHLDRFIPHYALFSLIGCFLLNCLIYWGAQILAADQYHYDFTTALDNSVPFQTEWVVVYILSYPFWVVSYAIIAKTSTKEQWFKFVTADMMARVVCGVIFIILPTTNVRPEIVGDGVTDWLMSLIYQADLPYNLFPSLHCLASLMCYLGMRRNDKVPQWYRDFTLLFAILIFASTQFTKQHYLVDVAGGVLIAIGCYAIASSTNGSKRVMAFFEKINVIVFGEGKNEG